MSLLGLGNVPLHDVTDRAAAKVSASDSRADVITAAEGTTRRYGFVFIERIRKNEKGTRRNRRQQYFVRARNK
jgi:hypothetical protein